MKIGILTYHHVINDGAILQAYAQVHAFKSVFNEAEVEVIDYVSLVTEKRERISVLKAFMRKMNKGFAALKKYLKFRRFIKKKLPLSKSSLASDDYDAVISFLIKSNYDIIVVGSDEVWKFSRKKYARPFPNAYWLSNKIKSFKVASAATANSMRLDILSGSERVQMKDLIRSFDVLGVRDSFTSNFISSYLGLTNRVYKIPDPTFAWEFEENSVEAILKSAGLDLDRPIFCLSISSAKKEYANSLKVLFTEFKQRGFQFVSVGQFNQYAEFDLTDKFTPLEWAASYRYFDFCLTDRFHSTIFSLKNGIPFLCLESSFKYNLEENRGKVIDLLTHINMLNHHVFSDNVGDIIKTVDCLIQNFNNERVSEIVNQLKGEFYQFLDIVKAEYLKERIK